MELLLLFAYFLALFWYSTRTDRTVGRLSGLAVDDEALTGWRIVKAACFGNRRIGLLNHAEMPPKTGLLLAPGRSVHTLGMLCAIDLVFLDRKGTVLGQQAGVQPGQRRIAGPRRTRMVLELPAGSLGEGLVVGPGKLLTFPSR